MGFDCGFPSKLIADLYNREKIFLRQKNDDIFLIVNSINHVYTTVILI